MSSPSAGLVKVEDGSRELVAIESGRLQLLDGQQRMMTLSQVFDGEVSQDRRLFMDMSYPRPTKALGRGKRHKSESLQYLKWVEQDSEPEKRTWKVDLSGFRKWYEAEARSTSSKLLDRGWITVENVLDRLRALDPDFEEGADEPVLPVLVENLRRLLRVWRYKVPVVYTTVDSPTNVLDLFTRANMEGVRVTGPDIYLAAVRTHWHDVDSHLDALVAAAPMLRNRMGALTFISRIVQNKRDARDPLPLDANLLLGDGGEELIEQLEEVGQVDGALARKLRDFTELYRKKGGLGWASALYRQELWHDILGWVASGLGQESSWVDNLDDIDTYLLGSTLFDYRSVFGDKVHRRMFKECVEAGAEGDVFPLGELLSISHNPSELSFRRSRSLADPQTNAGKETLLKAGGRQLVALAQKIPFGGLEGGLDWDHFVPQEAGLRMKVHEGHNGRKINHQDRWILGHIGNFWILPASKNRSLGKKAGNVKHEALLEWSDAGTADDGRGRVWPREQWSLEESEIKSFSEVVALLTQADGRGDANDVVVNEAMGKFKATVECRGRRLLSEAFARYEKLWEFGVESGPGGEHAGSEGQN